MYSLAPSRTALSWFPRTTTALAQEGVAGRPLLARVSEAGGDALEVRVQVGQQRKHRISQASASVRRRAAFRGREMPDTSSHSPTLAPHWQSQDFKALVRRRWTVSALLLVALFVTYYGYILLIATNKSLMARRVGEVTTLAIPVGIGVIVVAFALTAIYVAWANQKYDPEVERLKKQLKA
jgi:uncharacterized membrane protein (DUF485 family)